MKGFSLEIEKVPRFLGHGFYRFYSFICQIHLPLVLPTFAEGFLWCEALWTEAQIGACQNGSQIEVLGDVPRDLGPHDFCRYTKNYIVFVIHVTYVHTNII